MNTIVKSTIKPLKFTATERYRLGAPSCKMSSSKTAISMRSRPLWKTGHHHLFRVISGSFLRPTCASHQLWPTRRLVPSPKRGFTWRVSPHWWWNNGNLHGNLLDLPWMVIKHSFGDARNLPAVAGQHHRYSWDCGWISSSEGAIPSQVEAQL